MRKPRTRSPRVVAPRKTSVAPKARAMKINEMLVPRPTHAWIGNTPTFPTRRDPFSPEELAGLEIPAFLKRDLPATIVG